MAEVCMITGCKKVDDKKKAPSYRRDFVSCVCIVKIRLNNILSTVPYGAAIKVKVKKVKPVVRANGHVYHLSDAKVGGIFISDK